ncbi:MAG: hypothetical protein ABSE84_29990, partial [Isosphaeraceae bacterium]
DFSEFDVSEAAGGELGRKIALNGIPAPRFPSFQERFGMKLKHRVVHLRRSFAGLEARGPS